MKTNNQVLAVITLVITLFTSCTAVADKSDKSDKFIGTWERVDKPEHPIVISKSGVNFIVQMPYYNGGYRKDVKNTASYNKDQDKLELSAYGQKIDIIYDEQTNHLLFYGNEYVKKKTESVSMNSSERKKKLEDRLQRQKESLADSEKKVSDYKKSKGYSEAPDSPQPDDVILKSYLMRVEEESAQVKRLEEELKIAEKN
jgi:hypothetical protein